MRNTFVTIFLIIISFGLGVSIDRSKIPLKFTKIDEQIEIPEEIIEQQTGEEVEAEYVEYKSPNGFSFLYDNGLQLENGAIILPGDYRISAVVAVRYVKEQRCGQSGLVEHCSPFFENPAIAFGVVEKTFESLKTNELKDVVDFSEEISLAGKKGIQFYAGVEGEGIVTMALPLNEKQTILIQYTFDQFVDSIESRRPEIYTSAQQKEAVDNVLSTLKIN